MTHPAPWVLRRARLPEGRERQHLEDLVDLYVADGRIAAVAPRLALPAGTPEIDAGGDLVTPPFVDAHFHLDSALTAGQPRHNASGTLLEGIAIWAELKPTLTVEAVIERALRYVDLAVARGIGAIRSHVDVSDPRLLVVQALLEVKRRVAPYLDLQLVAFPQDGLLRAPGNLENLKRALDLGVEVVGGIPHFERTMADGTESVRVLLELAAERGLMADLHCDESDDPLSRHVESVAAHTQRLAMHGRVTGSHLTSMHSMDNYYVSKLIPLMAEAELNVVANPLINITLQGRHDTYPKRRGMTRVPELMDAGLTVAFGHDCVMDPWYAMGQADMLEVAAMGIHIAPMTSEAGIARAFEAVTTHAARILDLARDHGRGAYGLSPGCRADFVLLAAGSVFDALRLKPARRLVVRGGRVLARSEPAPIELDLPGRPSRLDASSASSASSISTR
jgi:cytosine/creatinine deaminase